MHGLAFELVNIIFRERFTKKPKNLRFRNQ
jgi:hypothetical protein